MNKIIIPTAQDKIAMALAHRTMTFSVYCKEHEYCQADIESGKARSSWLECKRISEGLVVLSIEELRELLE